MEEIRKKEREGENVLDKQLTDEGKKRRWYSLNYFPFFLFFLPDFFLFSCILSDKFFLFLLSLLEFLSRFSYTRFAYSFRPLHSPFSFCFILCDSLLSFHHLLLLLRLLSSFSQQATHPLVPFLYTLLQIPSLPPLILLLPLSYYHNLSFIHSASLTIPLPPPPRPPLTLSLFLLRLAAHTHLKQRNQQLSSANKSILLAQVKNIISKVSLPCGAPANVRRLYAIPVY